MTLPGKTLEHKLLLNSSVDRESGCWRWTGSHTPNGYGQIRIGALNMLTHRVAYELWVGPIPAGLHLDHVATRGCCHRDCLNPAHLEPVTQAENNRRQAEATTRCIHGHEYTPSNIYVAPDGRRFCRACKNDRDKAYRQRKAIDTRRSA